MPAPAPSANTFITNLRLLDLDVLPDWPQITAETWTAKDQNQSLRQRIRCTEWALYRLFELYDGHLTHEKFSQHFPPLEPQQSKNLRDSLYRELTQLKKDGVLPSRVSILRTTLEECKWEKVADVLLFFSTLVLKRICLDEELGGKTPRKGKWRSKIPQRAIARNLAQVEPSLLQDAKSTLSPLALAHGASLTRLLEKKQEHRDKYSTFSLLLDGKSEHIVLRQEELEHVANLLDRTSTTNPNFASLQRKLQENWFGNTKWLDALVYGESQTADDVFFGLKDREVWKAVVTGREPTNGKLDIGLVEELEKRVRRQEQRLKGWKSLQDKLGKSASTKATEAVRQHKEASSEPKIRFTAHQTLKIGQPVSAMPNIEHRPLEVNRSFHYTIMDMEAQLEQVSKSRKQGGAGWSSERPSVVWIAPAVIKDQERFVKDATLPHKPVQAAASRLPRGPRTTGVPTRTISALTSNVSRPKMLRPVTELTIGTNTSSIFSKPLVSGQASAGADVSGSYFPPLNSASLAALSSRPSSRSETRRRPTLVSLSTDTTLVPPPRDDDLPTSTSEEFSSSPSEPPSPVPSRQTFNQPSSQPPSRAPDVTDQLAEELGRLSVSPQSVERRLLPTERTKLFLPHDCDEDDADEETPRPKHVRQLSLAEQILNSVTLGTPSPTKKAPLQRPQPTRHLSLAERTRLSMAQAMNPHISHLDSDPDDEVPALPALSPQAEAPSTSNLDRRASLMERTRESMACAAAQHQQRPKPQQRNSARHSRQSMYPVNQFETPAKRQTINWDAETVEEEEGGERTPKEKLFEEDVDMASVFKSRPKIALSPVLTPVKGMILGASMGGGSDEGYDS